MTADHYSERFRRHGHSYGNAMRLYPQARREEFEQVARRIGSLPAWATVVDVPAGGGYLARHLPRGCAWRGHEPCASFAPTGGDGVETALLPLPWPDALAQAAVSVAGVHHLGDKRAFFSELARVVLPGGRLVLADVWAGSAVAAFLDDFVGAYNSTGHEGCYLGEHTADELRDAGWHPGRPERVALRWHFPDHAALGHFCQALFDLRGISRGAVIDNADRILGIRRHARGVALEWELACVTARR